LDGLASAQLSPLLSPDSNPRLGGETVVEIRNPDYGYKHGLRGGWLERKRNNFTFPGLSVQASHSQFISPLTLINPGVTLPSSRKVIFENGFYFITGKLLGVGSGPIVGNPGIY
jgi:hypothetical protein